jgi:apolipoprotein N-acyltransferase
VCFVLGLANMFGLAPLYSSAGGVAVVTFLLWWVAGWCALWLGVRDTSLHKVWKVVISGGVSLVIVALLDTLAYGLILTATVL